MDDIACATGLVGEVPDALDVNNPLAESRFVYHVWTLVGVLAKAIAAGFKFKLDKAFLCQLQIKALGFIIGRGTKSLDPDKVVGIVGCPRPTRPSDVDSFLGGVSFLRAHCATNFSEVGKEMRSLIKAKQERNGWTGPPGRRRLFLLPDVEDHITVVSNDTSLVPEAQWVPGRELDVLSFLRSGTCVWTWNAELSFRALKRMVVGAVDLYLPDFQGASTGVNPFLLWPDASGIAVGAGLFQYGKRSNVEELMAYAGRRPELQRRAIARIERGEPISQDAIDRVHLFETSLSGVDVEEALLDLPPPIDDVRECNDFVKAEGEVGPSETEQIEIVEEGSVRPGGSRLVVTPTDTATQDSSAPEPPTPDIRQQALRSKVPKTTFVTVAAFSSSDSGPVTFAGEHLDGPWQGEWGYPTAVASSGMTLQSRAAAALKETTGVAFPLERFVPIPQIQRGMEASILIVEVAKKQKFPDGAFPESSPKMKSLGWHSAHWARTEAQGQLLMIVSKAWLFLGHLESACDGSEELILRPIVLWSRSKINCASDVTPEPN